jgi:hypothetical protein
MKNEMNLEGFHIARFDKIFRKDNCQFFRHLLSMHDHHLGLLYIRSQGQCSTQIQHSYWCKS